MSTKVAKPVYRDIRSLAIRLGYSSGETARMKRQAEDTAMMARLEALRCQSGLTQAMVARRMGVTQSTVSRLESGRWQDLRMGELDAYLKAIGVPMSVAVGNHR